MDFYAQEIYNFTYSFALDKGKKCMPQDTAVALWRLLFSAKPWPLLDAWCEFLEQHHNRAISKDTWIQLLDFCRVSNSASVAFSKTEGTQCTLFKSAHNLHAPSGTVSSSVTPASRDYQLVYGGSSRV